MRRLDRIGCIGVCLLCWVIMVPLNDSARASDATGGFYIEGGAGPIFLRPPQRDSLPFYETDNSGLANGRVEAALDFDTDQRTLAGTVALGYRSPGSMAGEFLGNNTRVELASNFYAADASDAGYAAPPNGFPEGYFLGMYFSDAGMEGFATLGHADISGVIEMPEVQQSSRFDFADFNLTLATDYPTSNEDLVVSPRVGLIYALFNQGYDLYAETPDSLAPFLAGGKFFYRTSEQLDAQYVGLSLGIDGRLQLGQGFSLSVGGTIMPLYAYTRMDLDYRGRAWPGIDLATEVNESDEDFTYRAVGEVELVFRREPLTVSLGATVDYWEAVPVVSYPEFPAGGFNAISNLSLRTPEIDYDDMVTAQLMFKIAWAF